MKRILISLILTISSLVVWGQGGGYGSGTGYPSTSLIAQGVVTYYRNTTQGGNAPKWYDLNAAGTAYISRDSIVNLVVRSGTATLTAGTVTISNTSLTSNSKIAVSYRTPSGATGILSTPVSTRLAGIGFTINSSPAGALTLLATDNSTVDYIISEQ